ncbi:hypothetical protein PBY51_017216 [Eleginops maclovinus]|uniref:Uncharacterized protein n=1 Tax=Eleginops maclovinus TaxID=56733 RepID=A0AAN8AJ02_ELEMC|nr:hypothetical protein PBY51_017216 [Eleginops maclovinus]
MGHRLGWQPSRSETCRCRATEIQSSAGTQLSTRAQMIGIVWWRKIELRVSQDMVYTRVGTGAGSCH